MDNLERKRMVALVKAKMAEREYFESLRRRESNAVITTSLFDQLRESSVLTNFVIVLVASGAYIALLNL